MVARLFWNAQAGKFLATLWRERVLLFIPLISAIGKSCSATGFALALRHILEGATSYKHISQSAIAASVGLALLSAGFGLANRYGVVWLVQRIVHDVRHRLITKFMLFSPTRIAQVGRADLLDVTVHDTERLDRMTTSLVGSVIPGILMIAGYTFALMLVVPIFGAISICIGVAFWLAARLIQRSILRHANSYAAAFGKFSKGILHTLERLGVFASSGMARFEMERRSRDLKSLRKIALSTDQAIGVMSETLFLLANLTTVALILVASTMMAPSVAVGDIMTAYLLLFMIRSQVAAMGGTMPDLKFGIGAFERIQSLLELPDQRPYSGRKRIAFQGNVRMSGVSFSFGEQPVLSHVDFTLRHGVKVLITGANGSGKTTLVNLLLGVYRPSAGTVAAEGVPYDELDLPYLLESVGYVPQEPMIFCGTIAQNIAYGNPSATLQQIEHAAQLAGAHGFIEQLAEGYQTQAGDMGVLLSGGQKQQIALARALLGHHSLLILDEPTNHLDNDAISALLSTLSEGEDAPAVLMISHDRQLFASADQVFALEGGKLQQQCEVINFPPVRNSPTLQMSDR